MEQVRKQLDKEMQSRNKAIKIFALCFAAVLPWYLIANVWLKFLVTFPVLCWASASKIGQVLGEGYTGVGMPGMSLGPSIILGWNGSIIALETTVWLVVGSILNFWILSPALYYSGDIADTGESNGLAVWPGGLNIYTQTGAPYSDINAACRQFKNNSLCSNATFARQKCMWEVVPGVSGGHSLYSCSAGRIMLSSTMWLTMVGISWTLIGSIVDAGIDVYCPSVCCSYLEDLEEDEDDDLFFEDDPAYDHLRRNPSAGSLLSRNRFSEHVRSSSYNEIDAESTHRRREAGFHVEQRSMSRRNRSRGESVVVLQGVPHTVNGRTSLRCRNSVSLRRPSRERSQQHRSQQHRRESSSGMDAGSKATTTTMATTYGTHASGGGEKRNSLREERRDMITRQKDWCRPVGPKGNVGNVPAWLGPSGILGLGALFVVFVDVTAMGMPVWGTLLTVIFSTVMSYGLGALMATTAQNMAMPSAMVLQLLFGFLLPHQGEPNVVSAALSNAIVAQSLTLLNDFKMAVLLGISTSDMLIAQIWGTFVGCGWSAVVYNLIMDWNKSGVIALGKGMWANLGAEGSHLLAQLFGEYGLARIFHDHPTFMWFSLISFVIGIAAPFARRAVPPRWRRYVPNTVLIGLAQFPPANAFSIFTGLAFALFFQVYLRKRHPAFYADFRFVSTSGMNSGVGIGGLVLLLFQALRWNFAVDLGGPVGDGCLVPPNMPQY